MEWCFLNHWFISYYLNRVYEILWIKGLVEKRDFIELVNRAT